MKVSGNLILGIKDSGNIYVKCSFDDVVNKNVCEEMIKTYAAKYKFNYIILRYFNAAGADLDISIGEDKKNETHLIPLIFRSIKNKKPVKIYGRNCNTIDKTCVRDFIHVLDIAEAHIKILENLFQNNRTFINLNVGTGI